MRSDGTVKFSQIESEFDEFSLFVMFVDSIVNKISNGGIKTNSVDLEDDEDGGADPAQDLEGSADQPLDF